MATLKQIRNTSGHLPTHKLYRLKFDHTDLAGGSGEVDLGVDLPSTGVVTDLIFKVVTGESTGTATGCDFGLLSSESGGDADGFIDGVSVATAGYIIPSLASSGQTRGALMREDESGGGVLVPVNFNLASVTAKSLSFTPGSDDDYAELVAEAYFFIFDTDTNDG